MSTQEQDLAKIKEYKDGFVDDANYVFKSGKGFTREVVEAISHMKSEPEWMRKFRLKAYEHAVKRPTPTWGGDLAGLNLDHIYFYIRPSEKTEASWADVPASIK